MREISSLENMCYLNSIFLDIIPKHLISTWSKIIKRDVRAPERFAVSSITAQEMQKLRRAFLSDSTKVTVKGEEESTEEETNWVSTCMATIYSSHYPLPQIATVINQIGHQHLELEKSMIDTGSQISLISTDYVKQHKNILGSTIAPMNTPCSLKTATGKTSNLFKGKIKLDLRFIDSRGQLTKKAEFHVLKLQR